MAVIGRQAFQRYLLFQQPIAASAAARFSIANSRALSAIGSPRSAATVRKARFHSAKAWSCQKIAASVWSAVRVGASERADALDLVEVACVGARERQLRLGPRLERGPAALLQSQDLGLGEWLEREIGEWRLETRGSAYRLNVGPQEQDQQGKQRTLATGPDSDRRAVVADDFEGAEQSELQR
jgi:hypothetical protein